MVERVLHHVDREAVEGIEGGAIDQMDRLVVDQEIGFHNVQEGGVGEI